MIKKYKKQIIISSAIILLPILIGLMMWNILPESMAIHWNMNGEANGWSSKAIAVFVLPVILLLVHLVCVFFTLKDPKNKEQNNKVFSMVLWIMPIISLLTSSIGYAIALGNATSIDIGSRVLLGLMFVIIGNYMPKCKQNHTIGIKITWTLRNEENWNKTHRFSGKVWVFGGIFLLATTFIPLENFMFILLASILILAFVPMIYSYSYYKKQLKAGIVTKEEMKATPEEQKTTKISSLIGIGILVFACFFLFVGEFEVQFEEEYFKVEASFWEDAMVTYTDIDEIEYRTEDKPGARTFGYGSFTLLMGEFQNSEFGHYTRYSYTSCDDCIVLTVDEKILVINGKDEAQTKEIFEELTKRIR